MDAADGNTTVGLADVDASIFPLSQTTTFILQQRNMTLKSLPLLVIDDETAAYIGPSLFDYGHDFASVFLLICSFRRGGRASRFDYLGYNDYFSFYVCYHHLAHLEWSHPLEFLWCNADFNFGAETANDTATISV